MPEPAGASPEAPSGARRVVGMILMVSGILLMVPSGLCTGVLFVGLLFSGDGGEPGPGGAAMAGLPLMVGSPFILVGWLMWRGGNRLRRGPKTPSTTEGMHG